MMNPRRIPLHPDNDVPRLLVVHHTEQSSSYLRRETTSLRAAAEATRKRNGMISISDSLEKVRTKSIGAILWTKRCDTENDSITNASRDASISTHKSKGFLDLYDQAVVHREKIMTLVTSCASYRTMLPLSEAPKKMPPSHRLPVTINAIDDSANDDDCSCDDTLTQNDFDLVTELQEVAFDCTDFFRCLKEETPTQWSGLCTIS
jgi:hypothetical protein